MALALALDLVIQTSLAWLLPPIPPAPASVSAEADPPVTPPTSPQRSQHAARQAERDSRLMGSPENRRTPAAPTLPPMPPMRPATFNGRQYSHLPAELADQLAALLPLPTPQRRSHGSAAPPQTILTSAQLAAAHAALPPLYPQRVRSATASVSSDFFF